MEYQAMTIRGKLLPLIVTLPCALLIVIGLVRYMLIV